MAIYYLDQARFDYYALGLTATWTWKQDGMEVDELIYEMCKDEYNLKDDPLIFTQLSEVIPEALNVTMELLNSENREHIHETLLAASDFSMDYDSHGNKYSGFLGLSKLRGSFFVKSNPNPQVRPTIFYENLPRYIHFALKKRLLY
jgi:hypothetical protein